VSSPFHAEKAQSKPPVVFFLDDAFAIVHDCQYEPSWLFHHLNLHTQSWCTAALYLSWDQGDLQG
jgi:hypothetical protein